MRGNQGHFAACLSPCNLVAEEVNLNSIAVLF